MIVVVRGPASSSTRADRVRAWCWAALTMSLSACAAPMIEPDVAAGDPAELRVWRDSGAAHVSGPWRAAVHAELGRVYFEGGALEIAGEEAMRARELDPDNRDAAHLLALIALRRGELGRAGHYFEQALGSRGAHADRVLANNYAQFVCVRAGQCAAPPPVVRDPVLRDPVLRDPVVRDEARSNGDALGLGKIGQLRAQSIAIDNSAAPDPIREYLNDGRKGQSQQATGGTTNRRTRQEYSSEELRDE